MDIFELAIKLENEGEALYRQFAQTAPEKGMSTIFRELAEQEKRHAEIFQTLQKTQSASLPATDFLDKTKNIFAGWKNNKNNFVFQISQSDIYRQALAVEQKSIDFYTEAARQAAEPAQKEIFQKIAREEKTHLEIIENIVEFIARPETWVEHAEFSKIGEEY